MANTKKHFEPIPDGENANIVLASWLTDNSDRVIVLITRNNKPEGWKIEFFI